MLQHDIGDGKLNKYKHNLCFIRCHIKVDFDLVVHHLVWCGLGGSDEKSSSAIGNHQLVYSLVSELVYFCGGMYQ